MPESESGLLRIDSLGHLLNLPRLLDGSMRLFYDVKRKHFGH